MRGGLLLSLVSGSASAQSSSSVLSEVDEALRQASVELECIDLFAIANGAGSFTGLRSGLATFKAFASTLERPVIGIPTLHAIGFAARPARKLVALIPAGRGELFAQLLSITDEGEVEELENPIHVAPHALLEKVAGIAEGVKWAGAGLNVFGEQIKNYANFNNIPLTIETVEVPSGARKGWTLIPDVGALAPHIAVLAYRHFQNAPSAPAQDLRAVYVRASDAELKHYV